MSENKVMTIKVGKSPEVKIRIAGTGAATINWDDGNETETHNLVPFEEDGNKINHSYSDEKNWYNVTITGENITYLECVAGTVVKLDVSQNSALKVLRCAGKKLRALDVSQNTALIWLDCSDNILKTLDVSNNTALIVLYCGNNHQIKTLDVSQNISLTVLKCNWSGLTTLDLSQNNVLKEADCSSNKLTELDVSQNVALTKLKCSSNDLMELDVRQNIMLTDLDCGYNQLTELDVSHNTALTDLDCGYNQLTELDVSNNPALTKLYCKMKPTKEPDEITGATMTMTTVAQSDPEYFSLKRRHLIPPTVKFHLQGTGNVTIDWGNGLSKETVKLIKVTGRDDDLGASVFSDYYFSSPNTITITGENITHLHLGENEKSKIENNE